MDKINIMINLKDFTVCNNGGLHISSQHTIYDVDTNKPFSHVIDRLFIECINKMIIPNMYLDKNLKTNFYINLVHCGRTLLCSDKIKSCFNPDIKVIEPLPMLWLDLWLQKQTSCLKFQDNENKMLYFPSLNTRTIKDVKLQLRKLGYKIKELYHGENIIADHKTVGEFSSGDVVLKLQQPK